MVNPFSDSDSVPNGLVFFSPNASRRHRRRRMGLVAVGIVAASALIWPVYAFVGTVRPFVLGFPFSFAWMIGWLILVFVVLVWFYRTEEPATRIEMDEAEQS